MMADNESEETWWRSVVDMNFKAAINSENGILNLGFGGQADIYGNGIIQELDKECFQWVASRLSENTADTKRIKKLEFQGHSSFGDESLSTIANVLRRNEIIDHISVSKTSITTIKPLLDALDSDNNSLTKVTINNTKCLEDHDTNVDLYWKLIENGQPLILKSILSRIRKSDPSLRSIILTEHHAFNYNDDTLFLLISALIGDKVSKFNFNEPIKQSSLNLQIVELCLHHARLTPLGIKAVTEYLLVDRVLRIINFDYCRVSGSNEEGFGLIFKTLTPPHSNTTITELSLCDAGISGKKFGLLVAAMVSSNESLQVLRLKGNDFFDCGQAFAKAQYVNPKLHVFDVTDCHVDPDSINHLKNRLASDRAPEYFVRIMPLLHRNCDTITTVNCSVIEDTGLLSSAALLLLLEALKENTTVTSLDLSNNKLTYADLKQIKNYLSSDTSPNVASLTHLGLRNLKWSPSNAHECEHGTHPGNCIIEIIESHHSITSIDVRDNYLNDCGQSLYECCKRIKRLLRFSTQGCPIPELIQDRIDILCGLHSYPPPFASVATDSWESGLHSGILRFSLQSVRWTEWSHDPSTIFSSAESSKAMELLCGILSEMDAITGIDISGIPVQDEGIDPVLSMIETVPHISELIASNIDITDVTVKKIIDILGKRRDLVNIDISNNSNCCSELIDVVNSHLDFNKSPDDLKLLLSEIENNSICKIVYNTLTNQYLSYLSRALDCCVSKHGEVGFISEINLSSSFITNASLPIILECVKKINKPIEILNISNCFFNGIENLAGFLQGIRLSDVLTLQLSDNEFGSDGLSVILHTMSLIDSYPTVVMSELKGDDKMSLLTANSLNKHSALKQQIRLIRKNKKEIQKSGGNMWNSGKAIAESDTEPIEIAKEHNICESGCDFYIARLIAIDIMRISNITTINLSHGSIIDDESAAVFSQCISSEPLSLLNINLSHNSITMHGCRLISSSLKINSTLQTLNLSYNKINGRGIASLIDSLAENISVLVMNLEGNPGATPELLKEVSFALINDNIYLKKQLPAIQTNEASVSEIDFMKKGVVIDAKCVEIVVSALPGNTQVRLVNLSGFRFLDQEKQKLCEILSKFSKLLETSLTIQTLLLDNCDIDDDIAIIIATAMKSNQGLETLSLQNNKIKNPVVAETFCNSLQIDGCSTLKSIDLSGNPIAMSERHLKKLNTILAINSCPPQLKKALHNVRQNSQLNQIKHLSLTGVDCDDAHSDATAEVLLELLSEKDFASITSIDLSHNYITDKGAVALAELLLQNRIISLNLEDNKISNAGIAIFRLALETCSTTHDINISSNPWDAHHITSELNILLACNNHPPSLKNYIVSWQKGGNTSVVSISGIESELDKATDESLTLLSQNIKSNLGVHTVDLSHNKITSKGISSLVLETLPRYQCLTHLDLSHNFICDDGAFLLVSLLNVSNSMRIFFPA